MFQTVDGARNISVNIAVLIIYIVFCHFKLLVKLIRIRGNTFLMAASVILVVVTATRISEIQNHPTR